MTTAKNARPILGHGKENFGLLANGSSGEWEVAIDESTSGTERWYAQIEGPTVSFYFEIPSVDVVGKFLRFLNPRPKATKISPNDSEERHNSLVIGKDKKSPIILLKDDEYPDRFFLVVGPTDNPIVRFTISGRNVRKLADALRQVQEDLEDEE
ncbi:MAG TPA: hypothetical protein VMG10_29520 [Gemmataceae bacterium]|nr:hypothetical protein [Gemmataceae bacterium]